MNKVNIIRIRIYSLDNDSPQQNISTNYWCSSSMFIFVRESHLLNSNFEMKYFMMIKIQSIIVCNISV